MAEIIVTGVYAGAADVLRVEGLVDGRLYEARGWYSATEQHYPPEDYGTDGHRLPDAEPRAMTMEEAREYARALLAAAAGADGEAEVDLEIADPGAAAALAALAPRPEGTRPPSLGGSGGAGGGEGGS